MFEGIINLQLPFMLISSGVSSVLYLVFLFINLGHPKPEEIAVDDHQLVLEEKQDAEVATSNESQIDYFDYLSDNKSLDCQSLQVEDSFSLRFTTTFRHCNIKHTYSYQFAGASFNRPPPQA